VPAHEEPSPVHVEEAKDPDVETYAEVIELDQGTAVGVAPVLEQV
jgi:hypothetical protein